MTPKPFKVESQSSQGHPLAESAETFFVTLDEQPTRLGNQPRTSVFTQAQQLTLKGTPHDPIADPDGFQRVRRTDSNC